MSRAVERLILITVIAILFIEVISYISLSVNEEVVTVLGRGDCVLYQGKKYCEQGRRISCPGVYEDFFYVAGVLLSKGFTLASIAGAIALLVYVYSRITRELRKSEQVDARFDVERLNAQKVQLMLANDQ